VSHHIIITGASQGIGAATAIAFAESAPGAHLSLLARNTQKLEETAARCREHGAHASVFECDVTDTAVLQNAASEAVAAHGVPTCVVNNAGIFAHGDMADVTEHVMQSQWEVNVMSAFTLSRAVLPGMVERGSGMLLFMASVASIEGYPGGLAYCVTKHAMIGLARALRQELKTSGVRVTSILPGGTYTPSWDGSDIDEQRLMPAEDIARAVVSAYLMSDRTVVEEILLRPQLGDL